MLSIFSSTLGTVAAAIALRSASKAVSVLSAGSLPPKYFSIMPTVLETRLPKSFAKSELMR